jgi:hypothetical protein
MGLAIESNAADPLLQRMLRSTLMSPREKAREDWLQVRSAGTQATDKTQGID